MDTKPSSAPPSSFMNDFQLALISDKNEWTHPLCPPPPGSVIIGVADITVIRMFNLLKTTIEETGRLQLLVEKQDSPEARKKVTQRIDLKRSHIRAMQAILGVEILIRFPHISDSDHTGYYALCEDWNIVRLNVPIDGPSMILMGINEPQK